MPASTMSRLAADAAAIHLVLSLLLVLPTFLPGVVAGSYDPVYPPTRWAVLIAGSSGYWNYRHQADICHAYQILRKGGLKDENIVIFMYDDIAYNKQNPRPGIIINHPKGKDVYARVPKDYVGHDVTVNNFFAVLLGNKSALTGGSGKVVNSGPNDQIFVYYSDHGSPGLLAMPTPPHIYADDLLDVLKKKHASMSYKSLVFYVEACESGSIFEGLLPEGLNIYATTASDATESSWATYCPGGTPSPPPEYTTCLGDVYSVSWMEDSETHDLRKRTLKQQYDLVKYRTLAGNNRGSHVIQYGDLNLNSEFLDSYIGLGFVGIGNHSSTSTPTESSPSFVNQRDADLVHFWNKFLSSPEGSSDKLEAQKQLIDAVSHRLHVDNSVELVGKFLFGREEGPKVLAAVRSPGQPLVDDWDCLKTMVRTFETCCGSLDQYGLKHMRALANICNAGITTDKMIAASSRACKELPSNPRSSLHNGNSA